MISPREEYEKIELTEEEIKEALFEGKKKKYFKEKHKNDWPDDHNKETIEESFKPTQVRGGEVAG